MTIRKSDCVPPAWTVFCKGKFNSVAISADRIISGCNSANNISSRRNSIGRRICCILRIIIFRRNSFSCWAQRYLACDPDSISIPLFAIYYGWFQNCDLIISDQNILCVLISLRRYFLTADSMCISGINRTHINTTAHICHGISRHNRILIIQAPYCSLFQIIKPVVTDRDIFIRFIKHHAVASNAGKYIFKGIILYHNVLTDTSVIWKISWENSRHTGIQLDTFLSAACKLFPVAPERTSCNFCILHSCKFQKMRFKVIKKCNILHCNIRSMTDPKTYKPSRSSLVFHTFIVWIPDSAIDSYITVSLVSACRFLCIAKTEQDFFSRWSLCYRGTLCI